jgi:glycerophosphoryl diester phosphodiesterase
LESVQAAFAAGAQFVEIDVQLTRDLVPVLLHDPDLRRTGDSDASIFTMKAAQAIMQEVNERGRLGAAFAGVRIPLLADVLSLTCQAPDRGLFVEIKTESLEHFGAAQTVDAVADVMNGRVGQVVFISYDLAALLYARETTGVRIGWVLHRYDEFSCREVVRVAPEFLICNHQKLPPAPALLWKGPWAWVCYEVADPALAHELLGRGVALVETMEVERILRALAWQPV